MCDYGFRMQSELRDKVMDLLKSKPIHNCEVVSETGCTLWQVKQCRKWLLDNGYNIKRKKQRRNHLSKMVISSNTEANAKKNREKELKKKTKLDKAATKLRQDLDALAYQREINQINLEALWLNA